ncbi:MAG: response regulator transcription factor [Armatimonadia bacterium]
MDQPILLVGCPRILEQELRHDLLGALHTMAAVPDLRQSNVLQLVKDAALIILFEQAAPRDLPQICNHLRRHTHRPLLVLLRARREEIITEVLREGADDCLPPNISARELVARTRAHLRRDQEYSAPGQAVLYEVGELRLDAVRHEVHVREQQVNLTPREFELLECLAREAGRAVPRDELLTRVWGYNSGMNSRTLDVHIGRLRQKIEREPRDPQIVITVPGVGYKLAQS